MFWHSAATSNVIDSLLDQADVQLLTILDQDEVLMEIRATNKKLLEFLTRQECMHEMLDLITTVPSADIPLPLQYKFANVACEVLTSDISFAEKIAAEPAMIEKLFHFFRDSEPPVNPLLASFVCRVLGEMIGRKLDQNWYSYQLNLIQVMGYIQSEADLLQWLLKHVETSSVCDFFHKLVMGVEGQDMRNNLFEWLENKQHFFESLINSMDRLHNKEAHMNICRLVGDLLFSLQDETSSSSQDRSMDSEPFLLALKSHDLFERLLDVIFGEETLSQTSIVYGLEILLALLGITKKPTKPTARRRVTHYNFRRNSILWNVAHEEFLAREKARSQVDEEVMINPLSPEHIEGFEDFRTKVVAFLNMTAKGDSYGSLLQTKKKTIKLPTLIDKVDLTLGTNEDVILPNALRETLVKRTSTLFKFLQSPPSGKEPLKLSNGTLDEPLGMERLAIVKFIAHIITMHDVQLNDALIESGVLRKTLDLLWEHPWNNFLHHYVWQIVFQITRITRSNNCAKFLLIDYAFSEKIEEEFENKKAGYIGHLSKMTEVLMDALERNDTMKTIIPELEELKPGTKQKFYDFYKGKWLEYYTTSTQLLAGAPVPTSGISLASTSHNYESDPGVTWDGAGVGGETDNEQADFYDDSSTNATFGSERYDDEKSKSIFEMFCFERSSSADDEEEERNDEGAGGGDAPQFNSTSQDDMADDFGEWSDPQIFFKQMDEQGKMFEQMNLNGPDNGGDAYTRDTLAASSTLFSNPWADQESVQVDTTDPWAAFDLSTAANSIPHNQLVEDEWAKFDSEFLGGDSKDTFAQVFEETGGNADVDHQFPPGDTAETVTVTDEGGSTSVVDAPSSNETSTTSGIVTSGATSDAEPAQDQL